MFLPTTKKELDSLKWYKPDIILVTGDTYIDSPQIGFSVIGKILMDKGFRVAIIAQPDIHSHRDITRLGEPGLFWGISSGSVDSMVSNYTASGKFRNKDDLTPGGINNRRPDRALIVYANLIRRYYKNTVPIVLGGIEASLRRLAHYDYRSNKIRRSVLFDAKADILIYGMGEGAAIDLAECLKNRKDFSHIRGLCYISNTKKQDFIELPSYEKTSLDKKEFEKMFMTFYQNKDPFTAKGLIQKHEDRYLIHNPPAYPLSAKELDRVYDLHYERDLHPYYKKEGTVRALDTIRFSITTHRGCFGECNFCSIAIHQGRSVTSRSKESILKEVRSITEHPHFKGIINDVGGPTANMYGITCCKMTNSGCCKNKRCLFPEICKELKIDHSKQIDLLRSIRNEKNIKKIFIASGIRYDMLMKDEENSLSYIRELSQYHISGQIKIAPEHTDAKVLNLMGKPKIDSLEKFKNIFDRINREHSMEQYITYYFIAAHPGCSKKNMRHLKEYANKYLKIIPRQVQIFTPTPSTISTLMFYTCRDPFRGKNIFAEKTIKGKEEQKNILLKKYIKKC